MVTNSGKEEKLCRLKELGQSWITVALQDKVRTLETSTWHGKPLNRRHTLVLPVQLSDRPAAGRSGGRETHLWCGVGCGLIIGQGGEKEIGAHT